MKCWQNVDAIWLNREEVCVKNTVYDVRNKFDYNLGM